MNRWSRLFQALRRLWSGECPACAVPLSRAVKGWDLRICRQCGRTSRR